MLEPHRGALGTARPTLKGFGQHARTLSPAPLTPRGKAAISNTSHCRRKRLHHSRETVSWNHAYCPVSRLRDGAASMTFAPAAHDTAPSRMVQILSPFAPVLFAIALFPFQLRAQDNPPAEAQRKPIPIAKIDRKTPVDFEKEILPILKNNCLACHNKTNSFSKRRRISSRAANREKSLFPNTAATACC